MKKIKLVCFDVGDTLMYHRKRWAFRQGFRNGDYGIDEGVNTRKVRAMFFDAQIHKNLDNAIKTFMRSIGVKKHKERFFDAFKKGMQTEHRHLRYYTDTKKTLKELRRRGYNIAFITNWHQYARDHFKFIGLSDYADYMLISAEHGKRKPHPSLFKKVLKRFHLRPSEALMVGDHLKRDYEAAKSLGMHALFLERNIQTKNHAIRNLKQVLTYIEKVNKD